MLLKESKKLKINVTRLHSSLVSNNKKLKKLRLEKTSFLKQLEVERKRKLKESKIEAPTKTTRIDKIKKSFLGSTMSFFDKVRNFFGLVAFAILVKAIPAIVSRIKKFLDENPWIIGTIKFIWNTISGAVWVMKGVYDFFTGKGLNGSKLENERNKVNAQIALLPGIKRDLDDSKRSLEGDNNQEEVTTNSSSNFTGGPIPKVVTRQSPTTDKAPTDKDSWYASISEFNRQTGGINRTRKSQYDSQRVDLGGVGHVITGANWMQFMGEKVFDDKFFNLEGEEITRDEFFDKVNELNNQFDTPFFNSSINGSSLDTSSLSLNSFNIASLNLDGIGSTIQDNYSASYTKGSDDAVNIFNSFRMNEDQQENNLEAFSAMISSFDLSLGESFNASKVIGVGGGNATFGETDNGAGRLSNSPGWVHGHFQSNSGTAEDVVNDVAPIVRKLLDKGIPTVTARQNFTSDMNMSEIKALIRVGIADHLHSGDGRSVDISVPVGTKVPVALSDVKNYGGAEGVSGILPGSGHTWVGHLTKDSKSGASSMGDQSFVNQKSFDLVENRNDQEKNILALPLTRNYQVLATQTQHDVPTEILVLNRVRAIPFVIST